MSEYKFEDYAGLCALCYFDIDDHAKERMFSDFYEACIEKEIKEDCFLKRLQEYVKTLDYEMFKPLRMTRYVNENHQSGLVFFQFEDENDCYLVYRGSEIFDKLNQKSGWEDWVDNLEIWLGLTHQQLKAYKYFYEMETTKQLHLIGHSKGGHLALFLACICCDEKYSRIKEVVTLNACGMNEEVMATAEKRITGLDFLEKVVCLENENDIISSMFAHVCEPLILSSLDKSLSLKGAYDSHQIWGFAKKNGLFVRVPQKSAFADCADAVSTYLLNTLTEESKLALVHLLMKACER